MATAHGFFRAHHLQVNVTALARKLPQQFSGPIPFQQVAGGGLAEDDLGDIVLSCHSQQAACEIFIRRVNDLRAECAGQREIFFQPRLCGLVQRARIFHMDGQPRAFQAVGHAPGPADERLGQRAGAHGHHQAVAGFPGARAGLRAMKFLGVRADVVGGEPQRQFAQGGEIGLAEKILRGARGAFRQINLSLPEPGDQLRRRQIHQFNFRRIQNAVGNGLANFRAGDLAHRVGAAFEMLDIQRGEHINARVEQFVHILPALGVPRAGRVGMREFIHQRKLRTAGEHGVQVHLREHHAAILGMLGRDERNAHGERVGFLAAVGFHVADDQVAPVFQLALRRFEHGVGLAHAGAHAEKDLEPPALLARGLGLEGRQQGVRIGALAVVHKVNLS